MIINHNLGAMNAQRQMSTNQNNMGDSMEKLSSGLRINRAGDDAAGLAISEKMRGQIRGLEQADRNAQDGVSLIQTAEGALNETHSILQRMRELAVQSSNDTNTSTDREELQKEVDQLSQELSRIGNNTEFNSQKLLNGEFSGTFQIGANEGQNLSLDISDMRGNELSMSGITTFTNSDGDTTELNSSGLEAGNYTVSNGQSITIDGVDFTGEDIIADESGKAVAVHMGSGEYYAVEDLEDNSSTLAVKTGASAVLTDDGGTAGALTDGDGISVKGIDISSQTAADSSITTINNAIETVSAERSKLGAYQNRLEHTINNLGTSAENLQSAESRIRDVDMAKEMMNMTKNNILSQASQSMLAQANQQPQSVLQLLQ
ncbi:flagellin [uncultured Marinococcus sp.]|uniref:flagellin N-terminal helical domain-containing protein n=1 Tax=uncultured Marinococcus sp. TaxID=487012 RepID=UPI00263920F7|nr:flagellin [uncultured Marinococcus sp.]